ncbi:transposase, partial [Salinicoccus albus]|uniref:transposase n=1 Tax=Salinicoccus albus TaxID=418756 RepID=UPI000373D784
FRMDKMDSHTFRINAAKMMVSLLAYNLTNWLRILCFPDGQKSMQIETIRIRIIKVASKLVKSARSLQFKLASSFVYKDFFNQVLQRIQTLKLE